MRTLVGWRAILLSVALGVVIAAPATGADTLTETFPFFPSLLNTVDGKPLTPDAFEDPTICAGCHVDIYAQWDGSMHSNAFNDPVFQALWKIGEQETEGFTRNLCGGCHTAVGVLANDLVFQNGEFIAGETARKGVHCDVCHTITASTYHKTPTGEPQNASFIIEPGNIKRGPYKDSQSQYHESAYSELHTKSEFCANCHNVFHPVNNFHIENTYNEWKFSVYAQNGIQCQHCHMMPVEKAIEAARTLTPPVNPGQPAITGPQRPNMFTHEFVGANFTVPALMGHQQHAAIATARLKSAAEVTIQAPEQSATQRLCTFTVRVINIGAGHNLPTSLTEVRQMWLDVTVSDANGTVLLRSGDLDADGNIINDPRIFNSHAVDSMGRHTVKPWEIVRFESVHTIPPKGSATERYAFLVPHNARGPINVQAVLRYRSYPQAVANMLLGDAAPTLPIVDMAAASSHIMLK